MSLKSDLYQRPCRPRQTFALYQATKQPSFFLNMKMPNQGDLSIRHAVAEWELIQEQRANLELRVEVERLRDQIRALQRQVDDRSSQASRQVRTEQCFEINDHGSGEPLASRE
jgi:hypothetical protein